MKRLYVKWFLFSLAEIVVELASFFIVPFAVAYATIKKMDVLPNAMRWFETHDNDLDGDAGWKNEHLVSLNSSAYGAKRWLKRVLWLYRNRAYRFSYDVTGVTVGLCRVHVIGDPTIQNRPVGKSGWFYCEVFSHKFVPVAWCYMFVWQIPFLPSRCVRVYLGWKIKEIAETAARMSGGGWCYVGQPPKKYMSVHAANPLMGYAEGDK